MAANPQTKSNMLVCESTGRLLPSTSTIAILLLLILPSCGSGRLSRPRHCTKGVQPVPKAVYHNGYHDKHNLWRWDSNLGPFTPLSYALTTWPLWPGISWKKKMGELANPGALGNWLLNFCLPLCVCLFGSLVGRRRNSVAPSRLDRVLSRPSLTQQWLRLWQWRKQLLMQARTRRRKKTMKMCPSTSWTLMRRFEAKSFIWQWHIFAFPLFLHTVCVIILLLYYTVGTHCAFVHHAAKLIASLLRVAG